MNSSTRGRDKSASSNLDVKGAKALFESNTRRQREPSPAPRMMSSTNAGSNGAINKAVKDNFSSFKEKFEQFTAPRKDTPIPLRKAFSVENVQKAEEIAGGRRRTNSGTPAKSENWLKAKTKIYEQLTAAASSENLTTPHTSKTSQAITTDHSKETQSSSLKSSKETKDKVTTVKDKSKPSTKKPNTDTNKTDTNKTSSNKPAVHSEKEEVAPISDRINRFANSQNESSKSTTSQQESTSAAAGHQTEKKSIKDLMASFNSNASDTENITVKPSSSLSSKASIFESKQDKPDDKKLLPQPRSRSGSGTVLKRFKPSEEDQKTGKTKEEDKKLEEKTPAVKLDEHQKHDTSDKHKHKLEDGKIDSKPPTASQPKVSPSRSSEKPAVKKLSKTYEINDSTSAKTFMEDLVSAIDNEQHVPMKQLIDLFEKMMKDNNNMKESLEKLKSQLDKTDIKELNKTLQDKLDETNKRLEEAKEQVLEINELREALQQSEERCEELEEINHEKVKEIEYMKLEMDEMRDQFHDDEVHETIILQQRLDDMARSLRIIHFRLKKADARLQETEREKETLLEEIRILQGGIFTDDEIKRMQALEGDLQSAKEVSVQLHHQLEMSEERQEKLEHEAAKLREEIKASNLENDRLRNNIQHLREQMSNSAMTGSTDTLSPASAVLVRQGSSTDIETLKSNLEAAIERENDLKEQLKYAEEEARMLRRRLRDIEHENDALSKQLRKLSQMAHSKGNASFSTETLQLEVIEIENKELRGKNDKLHHEIDSLKSQIKSLEQKLELMVHEQNDGPLSLSKNSLYYETKFELMTKEIEELRWQLTEREKDYKKLREDTDTKAKRQQLKKAITIDIDTVDIKKQLDIVQQEADILRDKLIRVELENERLITENKRQNTKLKGGRTTPGDSNDILMSPQMTKPTNHHNSTEESAVTANGSSSTTRLDDGGHMSASVTDTKSASEYQDQIKQLREDMLKMERNLQDDINSLTVKNSILRSLLEAINQHETKDGVTAAKTGHNSAAVTNNNHITPSSNRSSEQNKREQRVMDDRDDNGSASLCSTIPPLDSEMDNLITSHICRLPLDIQKQFFEKIENLELQLKQERERARAAESLLQQVKLNLKHCVLSSPIIRIMQPRKYFSYPSPPPSLIIKPSASNSPSHANLTKKLSSSTSSTPERMKVGQSLASHVYLGDFNIPSAKDIDAMDNVDDDMLLISIQQNSPNKHTGSLQRSNTGITLTNDEKETANGHMTQSLDEKMLTTILQQSEQSVASQETAETKGNKSTHANSLQKTTVENGYHNNISHNIADPPGPQVNSSLSSTKTNGRMISHKHLQLEQQTETVQQKKSNLRNNFFQNYDDHLQKAKSAAIDVKKVKKRVSFKLPNMERDISDMSISSNLSAADDFSSFHYDDDSDVGDNDFFLKTP